MAQCECGCGQQSTRDFLPGHDQKLRTQLESRIGGLRHLRELVEAAESYACGESPNSVFTQRVRALFAAAGGRGT
jgi:hypothetical protein